jgi:hypothetical protein
MAKRHCTATTKILFFVACHASAVTAQSQTRGQEVAGKVARLKAHVEGLINDDEPNCQAAFDTLQQASLDVQSDDSLHSTRIRLADCFYAYAKKPGVSPHRQKYARSVAWDLYDTARSRRAALLTADELVRIRERAVDVDPRVPGVFIGASAALRAESGLNADLDGKPISRDAFAGFIPLDANRAEHVLTVVTARCPATAPWTKKLVLPDNWHGQQVPIEVPDLEGARLVVRWAEPPPSGVELLVDGKPLLGNGGEPERVDAGTHVLKARVNGAEYWSSVVSLGCNSSTTVGVPLPPPERPSPPPPPPPPPPPEIGTTPAWLPWAALTSLGATVGSGIWLAVEQSNTADAFDRYQAAPDSEVAARKQDTVDARNQRNVAAGFAIVSTASFLTLGGWLVGSWATEPDRPASNESGRARAPVRRPAASGRRERAGVAPVEVRLGSEIRVKVAF